MSLRCQRCFKNFDRVPNLPDSSSQQSSEFFLFFFCLLFMSPVGHIFLKFCWGSRMLTGSKSRTRKIKTKQISVGIFANNKLQNVSFLYVDEAMHYWYFIKSFRIFLYLIED